MSPFTVGKLIKSNPWLLAVGSVSVFPVGAEKHNVVANNKKDVQNTFFIVTIPLIFFRLEKYNSKG